MTKPRLTIELHHYPKAAQGWQRAYLWRCTLPNGKTKTFGSVDRSTPMAEVTRRKVRKWIEKESR